jgi:hypothetical protein
LLVFCLLAADGSAEIGDIGGIAGHHVEALLGIHGVTMKRNTGTETGANRPIVAEELKSRSRCNGHPISMSAKNVASAFAFCEKIVNISETKCFVEGNISNGLSNRNYSDAEETRFCVNKFTDIVVLLGQVFARGSVV